MNWEGEKLLFCKQITVWLTENHLQMQVVLLLGNSPRKYFFLPKYTIFTASLQK